MTPLILVVDDEKRFQQLYADILSEAGYTVKTAASAEKALDIIREKEPAMIISDVRMQGMNFRKYPFCWSRPIPMCGMLWAPLSLVRWIILKSRLILMSY